MASKYVDTTSIIQVIGSVFQNPQILDMTDRYTIVDEDFPDIFHKRQAASGEMPRQR